MIVAPWTFILPFFVYSRLDKLLKNVLTLIIYSESTIAKVHDPPRSVPLLSFGSLAIPMTRVCHY